MAIEGKSDATIRRQLRLGMVSGGPSAFIGIEASDIPHAQA